MKIHFVHRTFAWESEARGKAHVHVVIIGFAAFNIAKKLIYDYESTGQDASVNKASNISPYLVEGRDVALGNREEPISKVPEIQFGNMPNDDGQFLFTDAEKEAFLNTEPGARAYIRPILSAQEYLHGEKRWCLWLKDATPKDIRNLEKIHERVELVKTYRSASAREATRRLADFPMLFGEIRQPDSDYVLIPRHSSENRRYIPFSYFNSDYIVSDSCLFVPKASLYHFGVLSSTMHMAWVRQVCGRLKSDYRYSNKLVYNNYPWPESMTDRQRKAVEEAARGVLDTRKEFPKSTLADLYDPLSMPPKLVKAHADLDRAVDLCYRREPFTSERQRVEFLFGMYERLTAPLTTPPGRKKRGNAG